MNITQMETELRKMLDDDTIRFDEYDANDYPIFVTDEDEDTEYYVDKRVVYTIQMVGLLKWLVI